MPKYSTYQVFHLFSLSILQSEDSFRCISVRSKSEILQSEDSFRRISVRSKSEMIVMIVIKILQSEDSFRCISVRSKAFSRVKIASDVSL